MAHSLLEPVDLEYLEDPETHILAAGGQVYFALDGDEVVGTCAAIPLSPISVELAKLAVVASARGRGIGRQLSEVVIAFARDWGASEVVLTSHTALVNAIHLYQSLGFQHRPMPPDIRYETANVYMCLDLRPPLSVLQATLPAAHRG